MTRSEMNIEEWAAAATAEFEDEPARRSIARVAIAAVTCAVIFAFVGSQLISHGAEFFEDDCGLRSGPLCGGFWDLWSGTPLSEY